MQYTPVKECIFREIDLKKSILKKASITGVLLKTMSYLDILHRKNATII